MNEQIPNLIASYTSYKCSSGLSFLLKSDNPITPEVMKEIPLGQYFKAEKTGGLDVLKKDHRTYVVKIQVEDIPFVLKIFTMHRLKDYIRYRRYAFSEFKNSLIAKYIGIPNPIVYGYFEKRKFGSVRQCGVISQFLSGYTELTHLLESEKYSIFDALPIISMLYKKGINHIDISPKNIFMNTSNRHFKIIDWQYCRFLNKQNDLQLCMISATFLYYVNIKKDSSFWKEWLKQLWKQTKPSINLEKFFNIVRELQGKDIGWKAKLSLNPYKLGVENIW